MAGAASEADDSLLAIESHVVATFRIHEESCVVRHTPSLSLLMSECEGMSELSCDIGTSESCQQFYEQYGADAPVFGCIQQTSPGLLRSLQDACGKAGIGWGNFGGRVPGLSPPLFPKP
jgi:hypothetical protein